MTVVKRKRKESPFEVFHHLTKMRKDITDLLLRDFGYSNEKFQKNLERKYGGKPPDQLADIQRQNLERQKKRAEAFDEWFICQERNVIISCLHRINEHVYTANSIYPSCSEELIERRKIHKINPKNITRMRRKTKKLCGVLCEKDFDNWMKSWIRGYAKYMSRKQRENICKLTEKLRTNHYQSNQ